MFCSFQNWLGALAVAASLALPMGVRAQDGQSDQGQSRQRDSQSDNSQNRSGNASNQSGQSGQSGKQSREESTGTGENRAPGDSWQQDDRSWSDGSSNQQSDAPAGLGVTLDRNRSGQNGAVVQRVHRDSPAEQMGFRQGDRITAIDGNQVNSVSDVIEKIRNLQPGDQVRIEIERNGNTRTLQGELESRREALVFRGQQQGQGMGQGYDGRGRQRDDQWYPEQDQTRFNQSNRGQYSQGDSSSDRSQNVRRQLDSLERQVNQLRREIDDLQSSLNSGAPSQRGGNRESQANYDEYDSQNRFSNRTSYGQRMDGYQSADRFEVDRSPGGQVGIERTRPGNDRFDFDD